jgi:hypothetical protein
VPLHQFCFENIENGKKEIKRERTKRKRGNEEKQEVEKWRRKGETGRGK